MPAGSALDVAAAIWCVREPSADLAKIRQRLSELVKPRARTIPFPIEPLPRRTGTNRKRCRDGAMRDYSPSAPLWKQRHGRGLDLLRLVRLSLLPNLGDDRRRIERVLDLALGPRHAAQVPRLLSSRAFLNLRGIPRRALEPVVDLARKATVSDAGL